MEEVAECLIETGGAVLPIVLNDRNVLVATSRKAALAAVRNNIGVSIRLLENLEHAPPDRTPHPIVEVDHRRCLCGGYREPLCPYRSRNLARLIQ